MPSKATSSRAAGRRLDLDEVLTHPAHDRLVLGAVDQVQHAARLRLRQPAQRRAQAEPLQR